MEVTRVDAQPAEAIISRIAAETRGRIDPKDMVGLFAIREALGELYLG
jgi:hypothetical protein